MKHEDFIDNMSNNIYDENYENIIVDLKCKYEI